MIWCMAAEILKSRLQWRSSSWQRLWFHHGFCQDWRRKIKRICLSNLCNKCVFICLDIIQVYGFKLVGLFFLFNQVCRSLTFFHFSSSCPNFRIEFQTLAWAPKKVSVSDTMSKKTPESVGWVEILFYFEILFLLSPLVAESISWKIWLTFHMHAPSRTDLSVHKNHGRKRSFFNKTSSFTFMSKIDGFFKEKNVISRKTSPCWRSRGPPFWMRPSRRPLGWTTPSQNLPK